MQITVESASPAKGTIVSLHGKLDAISTGDVEKALLDAIAGGEVKLLVDCSKLDFISSAGLRSFIMAIKRMKPSGGTITLVAMQRDVNEIIHISGLAPLFKIQPTRAAAHVQVNVAVCTAESTRTCQGLKSCHRHTLLHHRIGQRGEQ